MTNQDSKNITFLLADDHSLIRQGVEIVIDEAGFEGDVFQASNLQKVLTIIRERPIDFMIIDAIFPDGNSLDIIGLIKSVQPNIKILVFSGLEESEYSIKFLNAGANGFLSKVSEEEEIKQAILRVHHEGRFISSVAQAALLDTLQGKEKVNPIDKLTSRELQVVKMYAEGMGNLEIAYELGIKQNSVSTMKKRVFEKLNIDTLVELISILKQH
jgi:DNA-binding NarL/FixJ family response regulator